MNILILGGGGFLGKKLAFALAEKGSLNGRRIASLTMADLHAPRPIKAPFPVACLAIDVTDEWALTGSLRHDLERGEFVFLGGGVRFANECCSLSVFLRRNFTRTETVDASTSFGIRLELLTLGGGGAGLGEGMFGGG